MKLLLLVGCMVASALGGAVVPALGGVGVGPLVGGVGIGAPVVGSGIRGVGIGGVAASGANAGKAKVHDGLRDAAARDNAAQQWASSGENYGRVNGAYGDDAARHAAKAQRTGSDWGSRGSNWDQNNAAAKRVADQAAASAWDQNRWGDRADANRALKDQVWAQGNQWYQGRRKDDDIDFAYDKSFNVRDAENGGFELAEHADSHALDHARDRAGAYDRNVDKNAAWASAADAQKANRKSAASANSGAADSNWDKFARTAASAASANGRNKDWAQKLDQSQGANRLWTDARKSASDIYKDLATADGSYRRNAKAVGNKGAVLGDGVYGYGVAGIGGYAGKPGYGYAGNGYAKAGAAGDVAQAWDQAAKTGLRQADGAVSEDRTKASFARDQWLNDRVHGFDRNQKAAADDKGFSDWSRQAAKHANKADAAHADAAQAWNKDQSSAKFNEDLWKKDAESKRLSDRVSNKKVYKKWGNNKHRGGDTWERLKFDRDQADDVFGYDTAAKKDWAQRANDNRWNERYDANGRQAAAGRAAAAARQANQADWRKSGDGWQNAAAAAANQDGANRRGFNNEAWKKRQGQNAHDARARNAQRWDRDAARANLAAGSAGNIGVANPAVVGIGGVNGIGGYPATGALNYGYPVNGAYLGGYGGYGRKAAYPAIGGYGIKGGYY